MSLVVGLSAGEVILRVRDEGSVSNAIGVAQSGDIPFAPEDVFSAFISDPVIGFRLNPERDDVNSIGIQNEEIELEKPDGMSRIIVLGDSVSVLADWETGTDNLYSAILGESLRGEAEVINAAIPGYTTYQERLLLEHEMLQYDPDLVIVQYTLNDNPKFLHRLADNKHLLHTEEARRAYVPKEGDPLAWLPDWSYLAVRLRLLVMKARMGDPKYPWDKYPGFPMAWKENGWDVFEDQLQAINEMVEAKGGRVLLMMVPFGPQLSTEFLAEDRDYVTRPQTAMANICERTGVDLLDLFSEMEGHPSQELFYDTLHLTSKGHQLVADSLSRHLAESKFVARSKKGGAG